MSGARRILLATDTVGGVWTYSLDLARALRDLNVEAVLAVMGPSPDSELLRQAGGLHIVDTGLPLDWLADDPREVLKAGDELVELAARECADLVQLHSAALAAQIDFGCPAIAVQHSCVATWWASVREGPMPAQFRWRCDLVEAGLNKADAVVAPTAAFAADMVRAYNLGRPVQAVHNGRTPIPLERRSRSDLVITVGRLWDDGKNVRTLDQAAARLDVPVEAIGSLAGPNGTSVRFDNLKTPGSLPQQELAKRLSARPIFASSALYEPFGLSALEAAQAGCALVLSDIPTFRELWGEAALFVPARDPDGFAEAISDLLGNADKRERLGRAAQLRALRYTPDATTRRMLSIYQQVLAEPTDAAPPLTLAGAR